MSKKNKTVKTDTPKAELPQDQTPSAAEKRAATVASNRSKRIAERGYALPLVLTCKVTGKSVKYTSPSYIDKVIAKYGSLELLQANYTSREGRRETKATAPVAPAPEAQA